MVAVQDILTCFLIFSMFSFVVTKENDGEIRWYEFSGAVLGVMLYYCTVSVYVMKCMMVFMNFLKKRFAFVKSIYDRIKNRIVDIYSHLKKWCGKTHLRMNTKDASAKTKGRHKSKNSKKVKFF